MNYLRFVFLLAITIPIYILFNVPHASADSLPQNPGFETGSQSNPDYWIPEFFDKTQDATMIQISNIEMHSGQFSLQIVNLQPNDSRLWQYVSLHPNQSYRISVWVKTEQVGTSGRGANLSALGQTVTSKDVTGTISGWEQLTLFVATGSGQDINLPISIGIGGYGSLNTGKAWFDDIEIAVIEQIPAGESVVQVEGSVTNGNEGSSGASVGDVKQGSYAAYSAYGFILLVALLAILIRFVRWDEDEDVDPSEENKGEDKTFYTQNDDGTSITPRTER
jgi:dolichyl-phosphate-mannose-protein mannosyltransferase